MAAFVKATVECRIAKQPSTQPLLLREFNHHATFGSAMNRFIELDLNYLGAALLNAIELKTAEGHPVMTWVVRKLPTEIFD